MKNAVVWTVGALVCAGAMGAALDDAELDRRIEELRKADFTVRVDDATGPVAYELLRHDFEFGTALASRMLRTSDPVNMKKGAATPEEARLYEAIVTNYFTAAVMENTMKWALMEEADGTFKREEDALYCWQWCRDRGIKLRGHCIFWGVARWLPDWQKELATQPPDVIEKRMKRRMEHILGLMDGKIMEWDLNNEMMHQDIFGKGMGWKNGAEYFKWGKAIAPDVTFYVNEYGVLQGNSVDRYVAHIKELQEHGAEVGGIGDQAHYFKPIPPNEELWAILDKLGQFGLPVKITEFDLKYKDMTPEEHAEQVRRFYRVCFAHPAVAGIYMWGFTDRAHWRTGCGLWDHTFQPKPAAHAYMKLIKEEWSTRGEAEPEGGVIRFRGFPGVYRIRLGDREAKVVLTESVRTATIGNKL